MKNKDKTKEQLIDDLVKLRQRISKSEALEAERKQMESSLQQYAERQKALYELNRAITASLRLTDIYYAFASHAVRLLPYDRISVALLEGDDIRVTYVSDEEGTMALLGAILPGKTSIVSRVVAQGQPILRHNITAEADFVQDELLVAGGIRSSMIVPLRAKARIIGVWNIGSRQVGVYSPDDMEIAQAMADQLASAIENARLYQQAKREIADRQRAETALRESEERFRRVIVSISDHVYMSVYEDDPAKNPIPASYYISPNIENLLGYPMEKFEADWTFWQSLIHSDDWPLATAQLEQFAIGGNSQVEYRMTRADGQIIWVRDSRQIEIKKDSPDSKRTIVYGLVSDITERKQLEEQLHQSQKMEAVGRLAGGVAHDFNNLLTVIIGYGELLLHRHLDGDGALRQDVEQIIKAGERAASLIRQLLAFSRKQVLQPEVLNLNSVVGNVEQMLRRLIGEDIDLVTIPGRSLGQVKADPGQMDQVIINLAVNARDAMPQGGKLIIETANVDLDETYTRQHVGVKPGPYVMLALSDSGQGMNATTRARIFEPFFTTKLQGQGTGLGLATVHGIVNQSDGHIWVYSEPGQGTTFKIYLPRIGGIAEAAGSGYTLVEIPPGSETILLVEDEDMVRQLAHSVLLNEGYTVLEAHNGAEALKICEQYTSPIHLLITDVVMPGGMSGPELVKHLVPLRPDMKILYMSGYTDNVVIHHGLLIPETAFLEKPFTPNIMARKVREVLDRG